MRGAMLFLLAGLTLLGACSESNKSDSAPHPPFVKTAVVAQPSGAVQILSGTVRARVESSLAFQVGGRIAKRLVDAGQTVRAGQVLFELDPRDLEPAVQAQGATLAAAEAALATAESDLARNQQLEQGHFISAQALERSLLARKEAQSRRDAAAAQLAQANNARGYGHLVAPAAGVLIDVTGEPGEVVAAGQGIATLAQAGEREIEVYFPEDAIPPPAGEATDANGRAVPLKLRETSGAVDPMGRTRRARYTVQQGANELVLGAVVRARFAMQGKQQGVITVPIGAIDERGNGARVWRVKDGHVMPIPVIVVAMEGEQASIRGELTPGDRLVALGTHLLTENMAVRELGK